MYKRLPIALLFLMTIMLSSCTDHQKLIAKDSIKEHQQDPATNHPPFFKGADLSYVNELEDCGALYYTADNVRTDPFTIFASAGTNLVRLRLWHDPEWTNYSTFPDVRRSIKRAKDLGMPVLLDFHYSDDWADPQKQEIPKAWLSEIDNTPALGQLLYDYTYSTLMALHEENLLPEMVQVGNEINGMILRRGEGSGTIDWERNSHLINRGLAAVRQAATDTGKDIEIMLHIAQPENALRWFKAARENGIDDYDWIGISYYPLWSTYQLDNLQEALSELITTYDKKLMIVETAYPFTLENADQANNILGTDALIEGYPATEKGQLDYLLKLESIVRASGGQGVVYWEPAWISSSCETRWGSGSHWDNATLFDQNGKVNPGMTFYETSPKE